MSGYETEVLIIGSGSAGYTAAIYAARANLAPILVTGMQIGGQLTITTEVENYPGFADVIQGPWLMEQMNLQAKSSGAIIVEDEVVDISYEQGLFKSKLYLSGCVYTSKTVIIATGAQAKWLGIESESKFQGYGVSACATCDGAFFKEKNVAVVGGGNTAVEEALHLTNHAKKVFLIHRRDKLRAEAVMQSRLFANKKIEVIFDHVPYEILGYEPKIDDSGTKKVTGIAIESVKSGKITELAVDGVFIAIGHYPNTEIFKNIVKLDSDGYIMIEPGTTITSCPGVFAAGDVQDKVYRQAVVAAGSGCMAALDAQKFLEMKKI